MANIAHTEMTEVNTQTDTKQHPAKAGLSDNLQIDKINSQKVSVHPVHQTPTNWQSNPPQIIYVIQQHVQQQASEVNNEQQDVLSNDNALKMWLNNIELIEYYDIFIENGFGDGTQPILDLNNDDLKDMGISKVAHRKRILKQIEINKNNQQQMIDPLNNMMEGGIYSNDVTSTQRTISNPSAHSIQDSEENVKAKQRKIYDKEHIIWIFTFLLAIYDFITDIQVTLKWFELPSLCSQFKCQPSELTTISSIYSTAFYVITCSIIGVVVALIVKIKEAKSLYFIFKHPISKSDLVSSNLKRWKFYMFVGWIPIIIEDGVSLFFVTTLYSTTKHYVGMENVYLRSMLLSILSVLFSIMNSIRKHCKMRTHNVYKCARCCHCCWCSCISGWVIFIFLALLQSMLIMSGRGTTTSPLVNIKTDDEFCSVYNSGWGDIGDDVNEFEGALLETPLFVYPNCSGSNYEYELTCLENAVVDDIILHCVLEWEYKYVVDNISEIEISNLTLYEQFFCYNDDEDSCLFDVELETCDNFPINCNNQFSFSDGIPVMWACFEYCVA